MKSGSATRKQRRSRYTPDVGRASAAAALIATPPSPWPTHLLVVVLIGGLLRLKYLSQPMRYDESVTYLTFVARSWTEALSSYAYPNNHVFHTLLVKACVGLFGAAPWALRLPALIAGVAMLPWTFLVGRRLVGTTASYLGTAIVASSGSLTLYSTNARGYTIVCLFTLILMYLLLDLRKESSVGRWAAVVVITALGVWTIPVMLYPAGGLMLWFVVSAVQGRTSDRRGDLKRAAAAFFATAVLSFLLYLPILAHDGAHPLFSNQFVRPSRWLVFFEQVGPMLAGILESWSLGVPKLVMLFLVGCGAAALIAAVRHSSASLSIVGSMYVWCATILLVMHRVPFARVWLFLLAPAALLVARGFTQLSARLPNLANRLRAHEGRAGIGVSIALATMVVLSGDVLRSRDTGTLPDAPQIAQLLAGMLRPGDRVVAPLPSNAPLEYYLQREGLDAAYLSRMPADSANVYLIVNSAEGFTVKSPVTEKLGRSFKKARLVARYRTADLYRLF